MKHLRKLLDDIVALAFWFCVVLGAGELIRFGSRVDWATVLHSAVYSLYGVKLWV